MKINNIFRKSVGENPKHRQADTVPIASPKVSVVTPQIPVVTDRIPMVTAQKSEQSVPSINKQVSNSHQHETPVVLVTETYSYIGNLATDGKRLQDILNDSMTDYLSMRKVQVATTIDGTTILQELPNATIVKEQVVLALLRQDTHEAPIKQLNYRVRRNFCEASVVIHNLRIQGALHLPRISNHASAILSRDLKNFFALTDATIINGPDDSNSIDAAVVMVNKRALSLIYVGLVEQ